MPTFVVDHFGDGLWTVAVYLCLCLLMPGVRPVALGGIALLVSVTVEFAQLLESDWLVALRGTRLGGLLLGSGFLWIDLVRYLVGAVAAVAIETAWRTWFPRLGGGRSETTGR